MTDDTLYSQKRNHVADFAFDEQVAAVFDDMLHRSVPAYRELVAQMGVFAQHYYQANTVCYDLGSSLGACSVAMAKRLAGQAFQIIAVDNSPAMIERSQSIINDLNMQANIELVLADINVQPIENASLVLLNFTLQFIPLEQRLALLQRLYQGLVPGGALVLSEKCRLPDAEQDHLAEQLYYEFKRANGYSDLEIAQKREALEKVLIPETPAQHQARLQQAGFVSCLTWFQSFQFHSFVAIKQQ